MDYVDYYISFAMQFLIRNWVYSTQLWQLNCIYRINLWMKLAYLTEDHYDYIIFALILLMKDIEKWAYKQTNL